MAPRCFADAHSGSNFRNLQYKLHPHIAHLNEVERVGNAFDRQPFDAWHEEGPGLEGTDAASDWRTCEMDCLGDLMEVSARARCRMTWPYCGRGDLSAVDSILDFNSNNFGRLTA